MGFFRRSIGIIRIAYVFGKQECIQAYISNTGSYFPGTLSEPGEGTSNVVMSI